MRRHLLQGLAVLAATLALGGCASLNQFTADVSTFGEWPAGRQPGSYVFERTPSQQAAGELQQQVEDAARPALLKAGFTPAAAGAEPDVIVQLGARIDRADPAPWDDPFWWHGGFGRWHRAPWRGPAWGPGWGPGRRLESRRYDREVALLIRDRASGRPLYEARSSIEGYSTNLAVSIAPLFRAALAEFPSLGVNPRRVTVALTP